ncbi:unnamed protein product [Nezara viridula]|uniref:Uncharacterized protein n=1 Tax=Nezara viridula TaxID=85310 RepID=A0A9P0H0J3_NEZVI|nr:unnamed protein product [Nezara viridula]
MVVVGVIGGVASSRRGAVGKRGDTSQSPSRVELVKMYYQQYNMYKQGWYGYQPQQYLSCMHEEQGWLVQQPGGQLQEQLVQPGPELWEEPHPQQTPAIEQQQNRVPPPRSPYEWMKKPSYQTQPTPGMYLNSNPYVLINALIRVLIHTM